jgi:4-amino-4-deoxy-L-arabinose transferase-like glycosyltransferase
VLLALTCFCLYQIAKRILQNTGLAALAALSPMAIYYFAWDALFHYSHSVMLALSISLTFLVFLRIEERRHTVDYMFLGVILGMGFLSKYSYGLFLLALIAAALMDRDLRRCVLDWRFALSAVIAVTIATPHFVWLAEHSNWFSAQATGRFTGAPQPGFETPMLSGLYNVAKAVVSFPLPLLAFLIIFFPRAWWKDGNRIETARPATRLLERGFLIILAATFLGVIAFNASHVRTHYMFLLVLFPVYCFARINAAGPHPRALGMLAGVLIFLAVLIPVAVGVKFAVDPLRGSKARYNMPYAAFADQLKTAGFTKGTILGDWLTYPVAGNLRPYFPDSRVISLLSWDLLAMARNSDIPLIPPREVQGNGQCLLVWTPQHDGGRRKMILRFAKALVGAKIPADTPATEIKAEMPPNSGRTARLAYILVPNGSGHCR